METTYQERVTAFVTEQLEQMDDDTLNDFLDLNGWSWFVGVAPVRSTITTSDGQQVGVGDTAYCHDSVPSGWWADPEKLREHMTNEGYDHNMFNGVDGAITQWTVDEDDIKEWENSQQKAQG